MRGTVVMLVGPKGSGKTHIGTVLERLTRVRFLRVESIWLALQEGEDGWVTVERAVDRVLDEEPTVMIESLGCSGGFERMRRHLEQRYEIRFVRIQASLETCRERVRARDGTVHLPVSEDQVEHYNRLAVQVSLPWDHEIRNDPPLSDAEILEHARAIVQLAGLESCPPAEQLPGRSCGRQAGSVTQAHGRSREEITTRPSVPFPQDASGRTALFHAAGRGNMEEVRRIIFSLTGTGICCQRLGLIQRKDASGLTAADVAERAGHQEIADLLRSEEARMEYQE
jgi:shikimate kinase